MKITVNGERMNISTPVTLEQLIVQLEMSDDKIATEVNGLIVPHSEYRLHILAEGDRLEIVRAVGGG